MALDPALVAQIAALFLFSFAPSLLYLAWVRNTERYGREPWGSVLKAFAWGALGGTVLAVVLSAFIGERPDSFGARLLGPVVFAAVVIAPLVEEATKALGLRWIRDDDLEPEDGIVYGAAAGLGFAATENLLYELAAFVEGGFEAFAITVLVRSVSSAVLHASATSLTGYAIWKRRMRLASGVFVVLAYLAAAGLHGVFNALASTSTFLGLAFALALAIGTFTLLRSRVRALDTRHALDSHE